MADLLRWARDRRNELQNVASRAWDQVNMFDDGRTWQQRTPVVNNQPQNQPPVQTAGAFNARGQNFSISPQTRNAQLLQQQKQKQEEEDNLAEQVFKSATASEKAVANVLARLLPGGQNDIKAQNQAIDQSIRNMQQINQLRDQGKITNEQAARIQRSLNQGMTDTAKSVEDTRKSIPSRGQATAGVLGTAADILTAGQLPQIKTAVAGAKSLNTGIKLGSYGATGGLNAASAGGTKEDIALNTLIGAAFPPVLSGIGKAGSKGIQKLNAVAPDVSMPKLSIPKPDQPITGMTPDVPAKSSDLTPDLGSHLDKVFTVAGKNIDDGLVSPNILYTNPITSNYNKAVQGYRNLIDKGRDKTTDVLTKGVNSENSVTSAIARAPRLAFANFGRSELGRSILTKRTSGLEASGKAAIVAKKQLDELTANLGPDHNRRIYQVLEDKKFLKKVYGSDKKLTVKDLSPEEKVAFDKLVEFNKIRNDLNLETGQISKELHAKYADGTHSPRVYDLEALKKNPEYSGSTLLDNAASVSRKDIENINAKITAQTLESPYAASIGRLELALRNKANLEALDNLAEAGQLLGKAPNKNFTKLVGKKYGKYQGMYADKQLVGQLENTQIFNTNLGQKVGDLTTAWAQSPVGQVDKAIKTGKTALAPAVGVGNVGSNIAAFSGAANVNPATTAARMTQAAKQLAQHHFDFNPNVYRAEKAGLFSGNTGEQLLGIAETELGNVGKTTKNPLKLAARVYGGTDKAFGLGLFNELKARGLSDEAAVKRVHAALQNYSNAGRAVTTLADSPVVGKPFARFSPELLRIAKNNLMYNPIGSAAKVGGLAGGLTYLSNKVGETPEERQAREEAVGQTQLPFTSKINQAVGGPSRDISLNAAVPEGVPVLGGSAVNFSRISGLNFPQEPDTDAKFTVAKQVTPFSVPTRRTADGRTVFAPEKGVSSLTLRPLAEQAFNRDFLNREITDPTNKKISEIGKGKSQYENADGSRQGPGRDQELKNRATALASGYLPGFPEANAIGSAVQGKPDYYGKVRTPKEGILRAGGLKIESNDAERRKERVSTQDFYDGKDKQVKNFLNNNEDLASDYFKFNDKSRDRNTNKKTNSLVGPERWSILKGQPDSRLFNQLKQEAYDAREQSIKDNKKDPSKKIKPIDPLFEQTDEKKRNEIIRIRAAMPGDEIEREEILRATTSWYKPYEKAYNKYFKENEDWYKSLPPGKNPALDNDRTKEYYAIPYQENSALATQYMKLRYGDEEKGIPPNEEAGKQFFKDNITQLQADFADYKDRKLKEINKKRDILGAPPIDKDTYNNVTFGYEDDERKVLRDLQYKYSSGYGNGRGGGSGGGDNIDYTVPKVSGSKLTPKGVTVRKLSPPSTTANTKKLSVKKIPGSYTNRKLS